MKIRQWLLLIAFLFLTCVIYTEQQITLAAEEYEARIVEIKERNLVVREWLKDFAAANTHARIMELSNAKGIRLNEAFLTPYSPPYEGMPSYGGGVLVDGKSYYHVGNYTFEQVLLMFEAARVYGLNAYTGYPYSENFDYTGDPDFAAGKASLYLPPGEKGYYWSLVCELDSQKILPGICRW